MNPFLLAYQPTSSPAVSASDLAEYQGVLPDALLSLWQQYGWCQFNQGLVRLVDPAIYRPALHTWLGGVKPNYFPILLGGFGHLFYYRRLTPTDEDVCLLDPHHRRITTCSWSLQSFFEDYLPDSETRQDVLWEDLFAEAHAALGPLAATEQFGFAPALAMGGAPGLECVAKMDAPTHLELLFQLGL